MPKHFLRASVCFPWDQSGDLLVSLRDAIHQATELGLSFGREECFYWSESCLARLERHLGALVLHALGLVIPTGQ